MDYDELTLNPLLADIEAEVPSQETPDTKTQQKRRYWTPKEEERFYEIWGRENWRLTRHGKNTFYFGQWSEEMKERWDIDVKPEEVQCKVNQTKAKYRSVLKSMEVEKTNVAKWKKFDIVDRIVRNEYRPKDAEPIPADALEKSREFSPLTQFAKAMPNSSICESLSASGHQESNTQSQDAQLSSDVLVVSAADGEPLTSNIFNSDDSERTTPHYSNELFTDPIDEIKQEFKEEFNDDFQNYEVQDTNSFNQPEPQLTQLQTPQQQQQQQQQQYDQQHHQQHHQQHQQQQFELQNQPHQQLEHHMQQQMQQQNQQQTYEQNVNSYATQNLQPPPPPPPAPSASSNPRSLLTNNHYVHNNGTTQIRPTLPGQYTTNDYMATDGGAPIVNNNNRSNSMPAPRSNAMNFVAQPTPPRKRGRTPSVNAVATMPPPNDSLETMYLEEVRKKNLILDEQKEISRKRLLLEERKIALMEQFFPKCLELQEKILQKLNSN